MTRHLSNRAFKYNHNKHEVTKVQENVLFKSFIALIIIIIFPNINMLIFQIVSSRNSQFLEHLFQLNLPGVFWEFIYLWTDSWDNIKFSLLIILSYSIFQIILMKILPGRNVKGPISQTGHIPIYKDNGFNCYLVTLMVFCSIGIYLELYTRYSIGIICLKFSSILLTLSLFGLVFCWLIYLKGRLAPSSRDSGSSGNLIFDYYWGIELYPQIFNIDIKVFTNCRFGMTVWPLLILCFLRQSFIDGNLSYGLIVSSFLQFIYASKFFWWESGYYNTIDITHDRAGFYLCWGCLVFIPGFFMVCSRTMMTFYNNQNEYFYKWCLIFGIFSILLNYWADYQKQVFRANKGNLLIWDKPAIFIEAYYTDYNGNVHPSLLLCSGYWGLARHFHYLPELTLALSWSLAAGPIHPLVLSYFIFLLVLLLHRVERDDRKCTAKYGDYYEHYKVLVPYKIIPRVY